MSVSLEYYFNYDQDLPGLARDCNEDLGCSLKPSIGSPETAFTTFFNSVSLELSFNIFNPKYNPYGDEIEDDVIPFSRYKYELDVTAYGGQGDVRSVLLPTLLSAIYILHRRLNIVGILVFDAQILLAEYEEVELRENFKVLKDKVSGTTVDHYSVHFAELMQRMPQHWRDYH